MERAASTCVSAGADSLREPRSDGLGIADLADDRLDVNVVVDSPLSEPALVGQPLVLRGGDPVVMPRQRVLGVPDCSDRTGASDGVERVDRIPAQREQYGVAERGTAVMPMWQ